MAKKENILTSMFSRLFGNKKDSIRQLDNDITKLVYDNIPSSNTNGDDRAFTDLLTKLVGGQDLQYNFKTKKNPNGSTMVEQIFKQIDPSMEDIKSRKDMYNTYRFLVKNIPQLNAAIDILVENIMSPDEIYKEVFKITPVESNIVFDAETIGSESRIESMDINNILNLLQFEDKLFPWLANCLLVGNTYIEIIDTEKVTTTYLAEHEIIESTNNQEFIENEKKLKEDLLNRKFKELDILENSNEKVIIESFNPKTKKVDSIEESEFNFIKNIIDNDVFTFTEENRAIYESTKEENKISSSSSYKDYRDIIFNKEFDDANGFRKNGRGRPSNKQKENDLARTGNENYKTRLKDIILKQHESEKVVRLTNSGFLLGYLIIQEKTLETGVQNKIFGNIGNTIDLTTEKNKKTSDKVTDIVIDKILDKYSKEFSSGAITKSDLNNDDVRKTIASIIMEKKTANIRFVSPSYMIEFMNKTQFGESDYGISVLDSSLYMAKHYLALLISYTVFNITRAPEKRLFKIDTETDTNISQSVNQIIAQIKQKEIAFQDFHRLDAMPKMLTAYNDIYVPTTDGGRSPISVESIPGQSSNIDMSYLDEIRRMIIYATKVPPTLLGDNENSYHTTASQENQKFARTIIRLQHQFQVQLTSAISKIYSMINGRKEGLKFNKITFNPPAFTKVEQIATMVGQADVICNFIVDSYGINPENNTPNLPKKVIAKEYAKFIDWDKVEELYQEFRLEDGIDKIKKSIADMNKPLDQQVSDQQNLEATPQM